MPNLVPIDQTFAEIWRFFDFKDCGRTPENTYSRPQNRGIGEFDPKWGAMSTSPQ